MEKFLYGNIGCNPPDYYPKRLRKDQIIVMINDLLSSPEIQKIINTTGIKNIKGENLDFRKIVDDILNLTISNAQAGWKVELLLSVGLFISGIILTAGVVSAPAGGILIAVGCIGIIASLVDFRLKD